MKLNLSLDLDPIRANAYGVVDFQYNQTTADAVVRLHDLKYQLALAKSPLLADEAQWRSVTLEALCATIIANYEAQRANILAKDMERMARKKQITEATSEQAITQLTLQSNL